MSAHGVHVGMITCGSAANAEEIARKLVEERLAACVNIVPSVRSIYFWDEKVNDDTELLLVFKTTDEKVEKLKERVVELHTYSVPEVIAWPLAAGNSAYLYWVKQTLKDSASSAGARLGENAASG